MLCCVGFVLCCFVLWCVETIFLFSFALCGLLSCAVSCCGVVLCCGLYKVVLWVVLDVFLLFCACCFWCVGLCCCYDVLCLYIGMWVSGLYCDVLRGEYFCFDLFFIFFFSFFFWCWLLFVVCCGVRGWLVGVEGLVVVLCCIVLCCVVLFCVVVC